jgi:hypothetical protein
MSGAPIVRQPMRVVSVGVETKHAGVVKVPTDRDGVFGPHTEHVAVSFTVTGVDGDAVRLVHRTIERFLRTSKKFDLRKKTKGGA